MKDSGLVRVLVVDDEEAIRTSLAEYLEDMGFEAEGAGSAEDALKRIKRRAPDVAIVDMRLPGLDGNGLIQRAHRMRPDIRFLVFTGSTDYQLPEELKRLGVGQRDVLHKPLADLELMIAAIRRLCSR